MFTPDGRVGQCCDYFVFVCACVCVCVCVCVQLPGPACRHPATASLHTSHLPLKDHFSVISSEFSTWRREYPRPQPYLSVLNL